jgi:acetyl esterase/lipase
VRIRRIGLGAAVAVVAVAVPATAHAGGGCGAERLRVPGAERLISACLTDLTTAGTVASGHTDPADYAGLEPPGTRNPSGVTGIQLDGYFPDTSTFNTEHGWNHDSQFVIRLPRRWNGGLVVAGPPGLRRQYANDRTISDYVLGLGYAYAATDKGNGGPTLFQDGKRPGDAVAEWHQRVTELTVAAKRVVAQRYGHAPRRTYAAGQSAGGYLVRWQLEQHPELFDGGIDWEGVLFTPEVSLLTTLPPALRAYPRYLAGAPGALEAMHAAGYPPGSEPLWAFHYQAQWDAFQRIVREEFDPDYDGALQAGIPFCPQGTGAGCDTDYDYASRPESVHRAVSRVSLTGRISRPLITVQGTLDVLVPISTSGDRYDRMIKRAGRDALNRYYRIEGGNHTDGLFAANPGVVRPMLPCFRDAFDAMTAWVEHRRQPPPSHTVARPPAGTDQVNTCTL